MVFYYICSNVQQKNLEVFIFFSMPLELQKSLSDNLIVVCGRV